MFKTAQDTRSQLWHPTTCQYKKWEEFRTKLVERGGETDYDDKEEMSAWVLYNETLTTANLIASDQSRPSSEGCSEGSEDLLAEEDEP